MRDEEEIEEMAAKTSAAINDGTKIDPFTVEHEGSVYHLERLRGILDALDWVLDNYIDSPL